MLLQVELKEDYGYIFDAGIQLMAHALKQIFSKNTATDVEKNMHGMKELNINNVEIECQEKILNTYRI